jgi:hypothetical protein
MLERHRKRTKAIMTLLPFPRLQSAIAVWTDNRSRAHAEDEVIDAVVTEVPYFDGIYPYHETHIPGLTVADVYARLNDPRETYRSLDALYFAVLNDPEIGAANVLNAISDEIANRIIPRL